MYICGSCAPSLHMLLVTHTALWLPQTYTHEQWSPLTLHWFTKASNLVSQLNLIRLQLIKCPDHTPPWGLVAFSQQELLHNSLETSLIRVMLTTNAVNIIHTKVNTQLFPVHSFHCLQNIIQCKGRGWRGSNTVKSASNHTHLVCTVCWIPRPAPLRTIIAPASVEEHAHSRTRCFIRLTLPWPYMTRHTRQNC